MREDAQKEVEKRCGRLDRVEGIEGAQNDERGDSHCSKVGALNDGILPSSCLKADRTFFEQPDFSVKLFCSP